MRGLVRASERFSSHLVAPSYGRNRSTPFALCAGPTRLILARNSTQWRSFSSSNYLWNVINEPHNGLTFTESRVAKPRLSATDVLEGGHHDYGHQAAAPVQSIEDVEALRATFYAIIQDGQPDQVMNALLDPQFENLVGSMPQTVFVEVFHLLSPAYFIVPYREIHRPIHPTAIEVKKYESLDSIFDEFANNLATVIRIRQSAGHILGLAEYTHLLDCARSIGDALMADYIWHNMTEDEVIPDVTCYNHYIEAKVWDKSFTGKEKYHLRMTPFAYRKRRFFNPNVGWQGYRTAEQSVRKEVLQIFNEMTELGYHGDETTFINLILASSRVGHVTGIKNVLKTAWNVDVDALLIHDQSSIPVALPYDRSSPLYPSGRLLFAVAHAFGTNNDISAALRAIDFISSAYDIPVPETVWLELFERSFVLSRPRFGPDAERNAKGKVSFEFLKTLYETMTSETFNVRPTIEMHHILAKTAWDQARLSEFQHHIRAAYDLLRETRQQRRTTREIIETYLGGPSSSGSPRRRLAIDTTALQSRAFAEAVHTYDILRLRTAQQTITMERLARLLFIHHRWTGRDNPAWERRLLPQVLEEWRDFLPESLTYYTTGGLVQFYGRTNWGQQRVTPHNRVQVRRPTAENGITLDEEARQMDDDFIWAQYLRSNPDLDLEFAPLKRLFSGVIERTTRSNPADTGRVFRPEKLTADLPGEGYAVPRPNAQKQGDKDILSAVPGSFGMVFP
ncbi:hypothetical protein BBP40_011635 [Aspergillus hancockii]|nr:hypothetical protein BBP40_011635 [Aspergillus hancockii]